ncbi:MAG: hypothetical protein RLZZ142_2274 [Verrucomicrobiota bacterium]
MARRSEIGSNPPQKQPPSISPLRERRIAAERLDSATLLRFIKAKQRGMPGGRSCQTHSVSPAPSAPLFLRSVVRLRIETC